MQPLCHHCLRTCQHQGQPLVAAAGAHKADAYAQRLRHRCVQHEADCVSLGCEGDGAEGKAETGGDGQGAEEAKGHAQLVLPRFLDVVGLEQQAGDEKNCSRWRRRRGRRFS